MEVRDRMVKATSGWRARKGVAKFGDDRQRGGDGGDAQVAGEAALQGADLGAHGASVGRHQLLAQLSTRFPG